MAEKAVVTLSNAIDRMARQSAIDGRHHDLTMPMGESGEGLSVHCNTDPSRSQAPDSKSTACCVNIGLERLAGTGLIAPDASLRFGVNFEFAWVPDRTLEEILSAHPGSGLSVDMTAPDGRGRKIGRNDPCPCSSGRKYKKCCLP